MKCPVCKTSNVVPKMKLWDDRYGYPGKYKMMHCNDCHHTYLDSKFTEEQLADLYTNYYPRNTYSLQNYSPKQELNGIKLWISGGKSAVFRWVPRSVRILDIGCGFGESLGYHLARGCEVYGSEVDRNIKRVADKFGYNVQVGMFDPNNYESDFFDYVTMAQVLEHFTDPIFILRGVSKLLKNNGRLVLSTPNSKGWGSKLFRRRWINWHVPYHLQLFSPKSIKVAAEKSGLVIEKSVTITNSQWIYYQWIHLLTFPKMGKPSQFWLPNTDDDIRFKTVKKIASLVHLFKINHMITRVFDGLRIGDNMIIVLKKQKI